MMEEVWGCCCSWTALPEWHYYSFSVLSILFFVSLFFGAKKGTALIFGVAVPAALVCGYFQFHFHSWMRTPKEEADWQHKADVILSYGIFAISLVPAIALICFALISLASAVLGNSVGAVVGWGGIALAILLGGALLWQGVLPIPPFPFAHQFVASYLLILTYSFLLGHLYGVLADFHTVSKSIRPEDSRTWLKKWQTFLLIVQGRQNNLRDFSAVTNPISILIFFIIAPAVVVPPILLLWQLYLCNLIPLVQ